MKSRKNRVIGVVGGVLGVALLLAPLGEWIAPSARCGGRVVIKFATLAPEGTVWHKAILRADRKLRKASGNTMRIRVYPGGVAGDEKDVIRKMRLGQFHAIGATGAGMAEIVPAVHVLDLPFLFDDGEEVDYVLERIFPDFQKMFLDKGFRLLGFTEAGFVHFYSQIPISSPEDFRSREVKAWLWEGDPLITALYRAFGIQSVPLALTDVLTGLQTGMINTVFGPPAAVVGLQWHTKINYMTSIPVSWAVGGVLLTERIWKKLTPEQQETLSAVTGRLSRELMKLTRQDNAKAFAAMKKRGIKVTRDPTAKEWEEFEDISRKAREALVGELYSRELLNKVEGLVKEYRAQK